MALATRLSLLFCSIVLLSSPALSDLAISKAGRKIDLTSQIVRTTTVLKMVNSGPGLASNVLLSFPNYQAKHLAYLRSIFHEGTGKIKGSGVNLQIEPAEPEAMPPDLTFYSLLLPKPVQEGEGFTLDVLAVFSHSLSPFPEEITQADLQLVLFQDSAYYLSPYSVKTQSLKIALPSPRVESYTKLQNSKLVDSEIKYGSYENLPAFSYSPIVIHFESNGPFQVARELLREIEVSHWGNIQVTEQYNLLNDGARNKGGFSRFDYQGRYAAKDTPSFNRLFLRLPPRARSIYYRDEIGNVSTSQFWSESKETKLVIEPRYPMFGGWKTSFTIGYGVPLEDFLFEKDGKRYLNLTFGSPVDGVVVDDLTVKVILPEGSKDISVSVPFSVKQSSEIRYSHLDIFGRPVVVFQKDNVVPELNQRFQITLPESVIIIADSKESSEMLCIQASALLQVHYRFSNLSLLIEPMLLITGFLFFFITCIAYMHFDISISKSSPSYLAKLQLDEVQAAIQQVQNIIGRCLAVHDKLDGSLRDLSRTGDVQSCKAARKNADALLKDLSKEIKPTLLFLQSVPQAVQIWPKVEELVAKEQEMQDKLMAKHSAVVDSFERKQTPREMDNRVGPIQQKLVALKQEVDELLDAIDEF